MRRNFGNLSLVPNGLVAESVTSVGETMIVTARAEAGEAVCPLCGEASRRVHSPYVRHVRDLPFSGLGVRLGLATWRFSCERRGCPRRIFAERFEETVLPARARGTSRLEHIVHHLGLALGGRPAASFAKRLMLPVSNDTLLRHRVSWPVSGPIASLLICLSLKSLMVSIPNRVSLSRGRQRFRHTHRGRPRKGGRR